MNRKNILYIGLYLAAIILANLSVAYFGAKISILNSFLFIGLDLTSRDALHEAWHGKHLFLKMTALILVGSAISWLLNKDAGRIAIASFIAFAGAASIDTLVYHLLRNKKWLVKVNGSNIFSAIADSILFPTIAFGAFMPLIILGQFAAKFGGGFIWSLILHKWKQNGKTIKTNA